ncbi:hypothetical protein ZIOFF_024023 [Zingiber officinale]|uniref:Uncharacterized protein n=1 Tax=Zingiber officinale TaxID=94328 RepID=A0A8J5GVM6_ZINOF|nr:hypothetical protein ZIOFF_024023 [Zingiber officinale]
MLKVVAKVGGVVVGWYVKVQTTVILFSRFFMIAGAFLGHSPRKVAEIVVPNFRDDEMVVDVTGIARPDGVELIGQAEDAILSLGGATIMDNHGSRQTTRVDCGKSWANIFKDNRKASMQMLSCLLIDEDGHYIPAWVQIHDLPPDCWPLRVLSLISSEIDKHLHTDKLTRTWEQLTYAWILIEIDVQVERVLEVPIALPIEAQVELKVTYEVTLNFCETYNHIDHKQGECRKQTTPKVALIIEKPGYSQSVRRWFRSNARLASHGVDMENPDVVKETTQQEGETILATVPHQSTYGVAPLAHDTPVDNNDDESQALSFSTTVSSAQPMEIVPKTWEVQQLLKHRSIQVMILLEMKLTKSDLDTIVQRLSCKFSLRHHLEGAEPPALVGDLDSRLPPSPPFSPMELQSLAFALFIPLLLFFELVLAVVDPFASSLLLSPSPTPTFAPLPAPPKNQALKIIPIPPPYTHQGNDGGKQQITRQTSSTGHLNLGEKVGLSFLAVAVGLQVVLGGLLVCTRIQLRRMERDDLLKTELLRPRSP